jgi:hypothetical protein
MTATIIIFPATWRKSLTTIATTGREIHSWEMHVGDRRANIVHNEGQFFWRTYVAIRRQKTSSHRRFRPITDWTPTPSLFAAMTAAQDIAARTR